MEVILSGDVINSRKDFSEINWKNFRKVMTATNKQFKENLKIPLTIYSGDSFGAVCDSLHTAISIILYMDETLADYSIRFAVIEDEIPYGLNLKKFTELEGPALWKIEDALSLLKKKEQRFVALLENSTHSAIFTDIVELILHIKNERSKTQIEICNLYTTGLTQKEVAKKLKKSQQYISTELKKANFNLVREKEKNLLTSIKSLRNE